MSKGDENMFGIILSHATAFILGAFCMGTFCVLYASKDNDDNF